MIRMCTRSLLLAIGLCACCAGAEEYAVVGYQHQTIYHSPQTPGFTSWVGARLMPDQSIMVSFTQATGPVEGRPSAPKDVQEELCWPPAGRPEYDMTGLDLRNVHLRSTDGGKSWQQVSADAFTSCMNGASCEAETALADGTVLRGVWGYYLPYNPELPKAGYIQRSTDGTKTWGPPELLLDPAKESTFPKRIGVLHDGRVIAIGGIAHVPANSKRMSEYSDLFEPLLVVSSDAGKTWSAPIPVVPESYRATWGCEEADAAELPNGDLLWVFRRPDPETKKHVRWQGMMTKSGNTWIADHVGPAPFPHSGHPELLATKEGPVLHVATSGIDWTIDAGATWHKLDVPGSAYYPEAVQTADGRIYVFGHIGSDDGYGKVDQSIVMDSFRLERR